MLIGIATDTHTSVSYTHLDVYKRQYYKIRNLPRKLGAVNKLDNTKSRRKNQFKSGETTKYPKHKKKEE